MKGNRLFLATTCLLLFGFAYFLPQLIQETREDASFTNEIASWRIFEFIRRLESSNNRPDVLKVSNAVPLTQLNETRDKETSTALILFRDEIIGDWFFGDQSRHNPFRKLSCPYSNCEVTRNASFHNVAVLVIFRGPWGGECCKMATSGEVLCGHSNGVLATWPQRLPGQAYVFHQREPVSRGVTSCISALDTMVNYTWTYKSDSDVVYTYGGIRKLVTPIKTSKDYYTPKTKDVLWYVSNCASSIGARERWRYAMNLSQHIGVDVFGKCTNRSDGCGPRNDTCVKDFAGQYRFYLSFENSVCKDYITEKLYKAFLNGNIPIVRGLPKEQYVRFSPPNSFIHADDFKTVNALVSYLKYLTNNATAFNEYHEWRSNYSILSSDGHLCDLCKLATAKPASKLPISEWWNPSTDCSTHE